MKSISIIIATSGRVQALKRTLQSLATVSIPTNCSVEVIIVENGRKQGAENLLSTLPKETFTVRYFHEPLVGKSRALNAGVTHASGEILIFTDNDITFPKEWIVEMSKPLLAHEASVVVGGIRLSAELERDWMTRRHRGFLGSTEYLSDTDPSEFAGGNWACARSVFSIVPEFDCELGGGGLGNSEDCLFARQLKYAKCRFASRTSLCVRHHPDESRLHYGNWLKAAAANGRSEAYLIHHWYHQKIRFVGIRLIYFRAKLFARSLFNRKISEKTEGIPAWELSYRVDIAKLEQYLRERHRPRNYSFLGLRKMQAKSPQSIV